MLKVKEFCSSDVRKPIDVAINAFLESNTAIAVRDVKYSCSMVNGTWRSNALVIYEELPQQPYVESYLAGMPEPIKADRRREQ